MSLATAFLESIADLPPEEQQAEAARWLVSLEPRRMYAPGYVTPHAKQVVFLQLLTREAFFGGAAGPGKSTALLLAALQYVDVPGYAALIIRRTYSDLSLPGALMAVSKEWLAGTDARWNQTEKTWTFPSGATLTFGHLEREQTKYRYQGSAFQFIGWDELTQFTLSQYTYMFSRCRRPKRPVRGTNRHGLGLNDVPLRIRAASNPGGEGHEWVKGRFVDPETRKAGVPFIPARMTDNPSLDIDSYLEQLAELSPADRERLELGDWDAVDAGGVFDPDTWPLLERFDGHRAIRVWDLAATVPSKANPDPDWTVGMRFEMNRAGGFCVTDVVRGRWGATDVEEKIVQTAELDGREVPVGIEQEPGASGKLTISNFSRLLRGKASVHATRSTTSKESRARAVSAAAGRGEVACLRRRWTQPLYVELRRFPEVRHDDQVDTLSGCYENVGKFTSAVVVSVPTGRLPESQTASRGGLPQ